MGKYNYLFFLLIFTLLPVNLYSFNENNNKTINDFSRIIFAKDTLLFKAQRNFSASDSSLIIKNDSDTLLTLFLSVTNTDFSFNRDTLTFQPGESKCVIISFSPKNIGENVQLLVIKSTDSTYEKRIVLIGLGIDKPLIVSLKSIKINDSSAVFVSEINPNYDSTTYYYSYGKDTSYAQSSPQKIIYHPYKDSLKVSGLESGKIYFFQILAYNSIGSIKMDSVFNTTLGSPKLIYPNYNQVGIKKNVTLSWSRLNGDLFYQIIIAKDSLFQFVEKDTLLLNNEFSSNLDFYKRYYWKVRAKNDIWGQWSSIGSFRTEIKPPVLVSPDNIKKNVYVKPKLFWEKSEGASSFIVQISDNQLFLHPFEKNCTDSFFPSDTVLQVNKMYFWRVKASGVEKIDTSSWSPAWQFNTNIDSKPGLFSPENNKLDVAIPVIFGWIQYSNALKYNLQIFKNNQLTEKVLDKYILNSTSHVYDKIANDSNYYWRINAEDSTGISDWSDVWKFKTIVSKPIAPSILFPKDSSVSVILFPKLLWSKVAESYYLQVSTNSSFMDSSRYILSDSTYKDTNYIFTKSLINNTKYFWRVKGKNLAGWGAWSLSLSFKTVLPTPLLVQPPFDSKVSISPKFIWNKSNGAKYYQIQISEDNSFKYPIVDDSTSVADTNYIIKKILKENTNYFWHVKAKYSFNDSSYWSLASKFKTEILSPMLVKPSIGDSSVYSRPNFEWSKVTGCSKYRLEISKSSDFSSSIIDQIVDTTSFTLSSDIILESNVKFYWRVAGITPSNDTSNWSDFRFFYIIKSGRPMLSLPINNDSTFEAFGPIIFLWEKYTDAQKYYFQLSSDAKFENTTLMKKDTTILDYTIKIENLSPRSNYYWRVAAINSSGISPWSATWSFKTKPDKPNLPILLSPNNGALGLDTALTFLWEKTIGADSYNLQLSIDSTFNSIYMDVLNILDSSKQISGMEYLKKYYWRVNSKNISGTSNWSATWNFTTKSPPIYKPVLSSPLNNSQDQLTTLTFKWNPANGANSYRFQISKDSAFSAAIFIDSTITSNAIQVSNLSYAQKYYWRVNAKNAGGTSIWSDIWNFITIKAKQESPVLDSPANASVNQLTKLTFKWNQSNGADSYRFQISKDSAFSAAIFIDSTITSNAIQVSNLSYAQKYYWRVNAKNVTGTSVWSVIWNFTTTDPVKKYFFKPNPFNPLKEEIGTFVYYLANDGDISLKIYDVANVLVIEKLLGFKKHGENQENWNGRNGIGSVVANGVYFYILESSSGDKFIGKIAVLK